MVRGLVEMSSSPVGVRDIHKAEITNIKRHFWILLIYLNLLVGIVVVVVASVSVCNSRMHCIHTQCTTIQPIVHAYPLALCLYQSFKKHTTFLTYPNRFYLFICLVLSYFSYYFLIFMCKKCAFSLQQEKKNN